MELCSSVEPVFVLASAKALHTIEIKQENWSAGCVEHEGWQLQFVCGPVVGMYGKEWPLNQLEVLRHCRDAAQ